MEDSLSHGYGSVKNLWKLGSCLFLFPVLENLFEGVAFDRYIGFKEDGFDVESGDRRGDEVSMEQTRGTIQ